MLVHVNDIHRTLQQLLQVTLQSYYQQNARLHFHANIHIAALMLLTTRDRTEKAQRAYSELGSNLIGVALDKVNIFTCRLHRNGAITRQRCKDTQYSGNSKMNHEKKKPQQMKTPCFPSTEVLIVSGSCACQKITQKEPFLLC